MTIRANCKINIGLDILRRREDGFHELSTVMIPIKDLYDEITINIIRGHGVEFMAKGIKIDCDSESNLCVKAYNLMRRRYDIGAVRIKLDKRVPFGAGLGSGSSDATATILAINDLFNLNLSESTLIELAAELGSDTAFFVRNSPQLCSGRGEIMQPIDIDLSNHWIVIIKPQEGVSTREAYAGVKPSMPQTSLQERILRPIEEWQQGIKNDFEPHIFESHPLLAQIKSELIEAGATYASMSGSGSTVYGIFSHEPNAEMLKEHNPYIFKLYSKQKR